MRYSCDKCGYAATSLFSLKRHSQSKHEGVRYPCDQCEFASTDSSYLKKHKRSKHKDGHVSAGFLKKHKRSGFRLIAMKVEPEPVLVKHEPDHDDYDDNTIKSEVLEEDPLAGF